MFHLVRAESSGGRSSPQLFRLGGAGGGADLRTAAPLDREREGDQFSIEVLAVSPGPTTSTVSRCQVTNLTNRLVWQFRSKEAVTSK